MPTDEKEIVKEITQKKVSRRRALTTGGKIAAGVAVGAVVAGAAGYFAGQSPAQMGAAVTQTVEGQAQTVTAAGSTATVTKTVAGEAQTQIQTKKGSTITKVARQTVEVTVQAPIGGPRGPAKDSYYAIIISGDPRDGPWAAAWHKLWKEVNDIVSTADVPMETKFSYIAPTNPPNFTLAFDQAVEEGPDGIMVQNQYPDSMNQVYAKAEAKGIPIVSYNTTTANRADAKDICYVGEALKEAGVEVAKRTIAEFEAAGTLPKEVCIAHHRPGSTADVERTKGILEVVEGKGVPVVELNMVSINETMGKAIDVFKAYEAAHPNTDAVIGTAGNVATAVVQGSLAGDIPRTPGKIGGDGIIVAGHDVSEDMIKMIEDGTLLCGHLQQVAHQAGHAIWFLYHYLRYAATPPWHMKTGPIVADAQNIESMKEYIKRTGFS